MGFLLPLLETLRRGAGYWRIDFTTMFEDYLAGALLLVGAWACHRRRSWGALFLVVAWAAVAGPMSSSFWYQLEATLRGTATEPHNLVVVFVKFLLWGTAILSLVLAFRSASASRGG